MNVRSRVKLDQMQDWEATFRDETARELFVHMLSDKAEYETFDDIAQQAVDATDALLDALATKT